VCVWPPCAHIQYLEAAAFMHVCVCACVCARKGVRECACMCVHACASVCVCVCVCMCVCALCVWPPCAQVQCLRAAAFVPVHSVVVQYATVGCSVVQYAAVCCSVVQYVAAVTIGSSRLQHVFKIHVCDQLISCLCAIFFVGINLFFRMLQWVAACCCGLQCGAVYCSGYSGLQWVSVGARFQFQ